MSMVRTVVGGVDTHANVHVAAAIDGNGGVLGIEAFPADAAGYQSQIPVEFNLDEFATPRDTTDDSQEAEAGT